MPPTDRVRKPPANRREIRTADASVKQGIAQDVGMDAHFGDHANQAGQADAAPQAFRAPQLATQSAPPNPDGSMVANAPGSSGSKPVASNVLDVSAAATRNTALAAKFVEIGGVAARAIPFLAKAALPLTAAAAVGGAAWEGLKAYNEGKSGTEVAKEAGLGALDSLTVGQSREGSFTRRTLGIDSAAPGEKSPNQKTGRLDAQQATQFAEASAHYEMGHMGHAPEQPPQTEQPGHPHGWSNQARINSAASQGHALPYGGDPNQGPETWRPRDGE